VSASSYDTSAGASLASSVHRYAEPGQTLIFFDWDDTLFPTTEVFVRWQVPQRSNNLVALPEELETALAAWREALHQYLLTACSLSDCCVIVTNSTSPWVQTCLERFAPNLKQLFDKESGGVRVVYANTAAFKNAQRKQGWGLRRQRSKEMTDAKLAAMRQVATRFYSSYPNQSWKNILSLGDMKYEHEAVQRLSFSRKCTANERLRTKAILLPGAPSLSELALRLQFSKLMLPAYVHFNGDFDLDLRSASDPLREIAKALGIPQLGDLPFPRHAWGRTPVPEDNVAAAALDELAVTVHGSLFQEQSDFSYMEATSEQRHLSLGALTWTAAEAAMVTITAYLIAIQALRADVGMAEDLTHVCHSLYTVVVAAVTLSTVHWYREPCVPVPFHEGLHREHSVETSDVLVLLPWAERVAIRMYQRSCGFLWTDAAVALLSLAGRGQPRLLTERLAHTTAMSAANISCLLPGQGSRAKLCFLGAAYLAEASSLPWWLTSLACRLHVSWESITRLQGTMLVSVAAAGIAAGPWCLYLIWASRRHITWQMLQLQWFLASFKFALNVGWFCKLWRNLSSTLVTGA